MEEQTERTKADHDLMRERHGRVIGLVDMDAFEVQVYLRKKLKNWRQVYLDNPCVLADSKTDRIVSVNYVAKQYYGVAREDGVRLASDKVAAGGDKLLVYRKDVEFGKTESTSLMDASDEVVDCILDFRRQYKLDFTFQLASTDEFYLDLSRDVSRRQREGYFLNMDTLGVNTHLEGASKKVKAKGIIYKNNVIFPRDPKRYMQEAKLAMGSTVLRQLLQYLSDRTGFDASAGIGSNKLIAKLAVSEHKPGGITILPEQGLIRVARRIRIEKIPTLGGKTGIEIQTSLAKFQTRPVTMADLAGRSVYQLMKDLCWGPVKAREILLLVNGFCDSPVIERTMKDTLSVGKTNLQHEPDKPWMTKYQTIAAILKNQTTHLAQRLQKERRRNNRFAEEVSVKLTYNATGQPANRNWSIRIPLPNGQVIVDSFVQAVMNEYEKKFHNCQGMITKMNFFVKEFVQLNRAGRR